MRKMGLLPLTALYLSGCGLFGIGGGNSSHMGSFASPYDGLAGKTLAIVIYAPPATIDEYPGVREELSGFIATEIRYHLPKPPVILEPREVVYWQIDTLNWTALSEEDIGRHFAVDRVLFVEILDYSTRKVVGPSDLQGRIRAVCRIVETPGRAAALPATAPEATASSPGSPAWSGIVDVAWPPNRPLDPTQTNETAVRSRTLEAFSTKLTSYFAPQPGT